MDELRAMATHFLAPLAAELAQNKKAKAAKPEAVVAALNQELADTGLKLEKGGELRKVTVVNEHRPAHEFTKFFMDETAAAPEAQLPRVAASPTSPSTRRRAHQ